MTMHMRYALSRRLAILHRYIECFGAVHPFQRPLHARHGQEEIGDFVLGEVGQVGFYGQRTHQDMAREKGLQIDEREGVGGFVEDLLKRDEGTENIT